MKNHIVSNSLINDFIQDDSVEEIWINGPGHIFVARNGISELTSVVLSENEIIVLVEQLLRNTGRRLDISHPFVDATLPDGSRLHAVIPDITKKWPAINIRKFGSATPNLELLVEKQMLDSQIASLLKEIVGNSKNILISGTTGAGKTTFLSSLLNTLPANTRIITCEEVFELKLNSSDWVALQTREMNLESEGEVSLRRLIREALRMRPDRLVLGEVRQAEALDLLIALNSGMSGMATIHANSAREAINKLMLLPLLGGPNIQAEFVKKTVGQVIDFAIHLERNQAGFRQVAEIIEISNDPIRDNIKINSIYTANQSKRKLSEAV
jgi:pilus assembly protein CpaF